MGTNNKYRTFLFKRNQAIVYADSPFKEKFFTTAKDVYGTPLYEEVFLDEESFQQRGTNSNNELLNIRKSYRDVTEDSFVNTENIDDLEDLSDNTVSE